MSGIMRISIDGKDRCVRLKKAWTEHGYMYLALTTGETIKRSLKHFPTDRLGWAGVPVPSPLPNPAVMNVFKYYAYCAAHVATTPNKYGEFFNSDAYSDAVRHGIVFG